jgi:hypothetical protein
MAPLVLFNDESEKRVPLVFFRLKSTAIDSGS